MEGLRDFSQHIQLSFHVFQSFSLNTKVSTHVLHSFLINTNHQSLKCSRAPRLAQNISSIMWFKVHAQHKQAYTYIINNWIMFGYKGYSQKIEHLEQPLHTNRSQINTPLFVTWLTVQRESVHEPNQIYTWSKLLCKRNKVTWATHNWSTSQRPSMLFK